MEKFCKCIESIFSIVIKNGVPATEAGTHPKNAMHCGVVHTVIYPLAEILLFWSVGKYPLYPVCIHTEKREITDISITIVLKTLNKLISDGADDLNHNLCFVYNLGIYSEHRFLYSS